MKGLRIWKLNVLEFFVWFTFFGILVSIISIISLYYIIASSRHTFCNEQNLSNYNMDQVKDLTSRVTQVEKNIDSEILNETCSLAKKTPLSILFELISEISDFFTFLTNSIIKLELKYAPDNFKHDFENSILPLQFYSIKFSLTLFSCIVIKKMFSYLFCKKKKKKKDINMIK